MAGDAIDVGIDMGIDVALGIGRAAVQIRWRGVDQLTRELPGVHQLGSCIVVTCTYTAMRMKGATKIPGEVENRLLRMLLVFPSILVARCETQQSSAIERMLYSRILMNTPR